MKKKHLIALYYILALVSILIGVCLFHVFEETMPYVAYPVVFVSLLAVFVFAGLIDHVRKTERQERCKAEWEDMIRQNPSAFSLDLSTPNAKKILKNEIDFNDEKNERRLKKLEFLLIPYKQGADVALVRKCNSYDNLYDETQQEEPTDEQFDRYESWQMGYYFLNADGLAALSGKTFLVTENLYRVLQSINLFYRFMQNNTFLVGDAA